jgi:hypothetical protein
MTSERGNCLEWEGSRNSDGYGRFGDMLAHRVSFFLSNGYIFTGGQILHRCDNPRCIKAEHLYEGTQADNMADMKAKGRRKGIGTGADNGRAVLTWDAAARIREARRSGASLKDLANQHGVGVSTISRVVRGQAWV